MLAPRLRLIRHWDSKLGDQSMPTPVTVPRTLDAGAADEVLAFYLNQMRWYSRLIGWSSRATSAPSKSRLMMAVEASTSAP